MVLHLRCGYFGMHHPGESIRSEPLLFTDPSVDMRCSDGADPSEMVLHLGCGYFGMYHLMLTLAPTSMNFCSQKIH